MGLNEKDIDDIEDIEDIEENEEEDNPYENPENGFEALKKALEEKYSDNSDAAGLLERISNLFGNGIPEQNSQQYQPQPEFDMNSYFKENMIKEELTTDDIITISHKEKNGHKAVFITLGDLVKFIKLQIEKT